MTITVITCTYNAAHELPRTLASVESQDYDQVEHLIIDGKSKDDTMKLVREYEEKSRGASPHQIRAVSEPDGGLYDAMNKGIQMAEGDYLVFLNAGDTFKDEHTLQRVAHAALMPDKKPAVIYGDTDIIDDRGHYVGRRRLAPPEALSWKSFRHGMLVCHQAFYARTDLAKAIPYDLKYHYSADVDWCIKIMKSAASYRLPLVNTHAVLACFLDGGMTTTYHRRSLRERFSVMCRHYGVASTVVMHLWFALRGVISRRHTR